MCQFYTGKRAGKRVGNPLWYPCRPAGILALGKGRVNTAPAHPAMCAALLPPAPAPRCLLAPTEPESGKQLNA